MKNLFKCFCTLFILLISIGAHAQTDTQTGKAVADLFAGTDAIISNANKEKLQNQHDALDYFKRSLDYLKSKNYDAAYGAALSAMQTYHKFAAPYLIAAYVCLQRNDALDAHKYLLIYDKFSSTGLNDDLVKQIPASFITQLRQSVNTGFNALSQKSLNESYEKEGWYPRTLSLGFGGTYRSFSDISTDGANNDKIKEDDWLINGSFNFSQYIWLSKKDAFPTIAAGNIGIDLRIGADYQQDLANSAIASRTQVYFSPGVFLGKFYIAPVKVYYNILNTYTDAITAQTLNTHYYNLSDGASESLQSLDKTVNPISFSPEIRYYPGFFNGYAANPNKLSASEPPSTGYGYLFFKYDEDINSASSTGAGVGAGAAPVLTTYDLHTKSYMFGFTLGGRRVVLTEAFGWEDFSLLSYKVNLVTNGNNTGSTNYSIFTKAFKGQIIIKYNIL